MRADRDCASPGARCAARVPPECRNSLGRPHSLTPRGFRHAGERIKPVLTINKIDRCFLELQCEGEEAFLAFRRVIENANVLMATYSDDQLGDTQVYPERGNVCFSAGLHNWAFTLSTFAKVSGTSLPPAPPAFSPLPPFNRRPLVSPTPRPLTGPLGLREL